MLCLQRASTGKAGTPGTSARPKRVRREDTPARPGEELVGKVVKIYWPNEKRYFRGKVMAFDKDMVSQLPTECRTQI